MTLVRKLTIIELADLLKEEAERGVICGKTLLTFLQNGLVPRQIMDLMDNVRFAVERATDGTFEVTEYNSEE